jgi:hypothetical protein
LGALVRPLQDHQPHLREILRQGGARRPQVLQARHGRHRARDDRGGRPRRASCVAPPTTC